jgi:TPR repeat protein
MRHYPELLCAMLTTSLMLLPIAAAVAGPLEDADAAFESRDYPTTLQMLHPLADQGDATAQYILGRMYLDGNGVSQNYAEAVKWFRLSADRGDADAQNSIGTMYEHGLGLPQNYAEAVKWYRKAADQRDATAQYNLGALYGLGRGAV